MKIQWYPGHMTKAKRAMSDAIKLVDIIIEMTDARAPEATRNPEIMELGSNKSRIIILNKADLSDEGANNRWASHYKEQGYECMFMDSRKKNGVNALIKAIENVSKDKRERDAKRGIKNRPVRAMVAGIPNVGKSSLINRLSGGTKTKVENRPGVTRAKQWIRLGAQLELLDMPGILWPKFEDQQAALHLAFTGAINDNVYDVGSVVLLLLNRLREDSPQSLCTRYRLDEPLPEEVELLDAIGRKRGCLRAGGKIDYEKAEQVILTDFRSGRLGRISLDAVPCIPSA